MKKIFISFIVTFTVLSLFLLTGCVNNIKIPLGNRPTKQFTIVDYIQDDAIFQAKSKVKISGLSEEGVIIVATLYDNKGDEVTQVYSTTNEKGAWILEFDAPSASMKTYTLKLADSIGVYHYTFTEIKFGQVWLVLGDEINNLSIQEELVEDESGYNPTDYNKMFYYENKWIAADSNISSFGYQLIEKMTANFTSWNKYPIGVVFATAENTNIYNWLSRDIIESRKIIKDYLVENNLYKDTFELEKDDMSYYYELYLRNLKNMSYSNVIFNQGLKDIEDLNNNTNYDDKSFKNIYSLMLYSLISDLDDKVRIVDQIFIIQTGSSFESNVSMLRTIQTSMTNYFNKCELVPTYDITLVFDKNSNNYLSSIECANLIGLEDNICLEIHGIDFEKLVDRIYNSFVNKEQAPFLNDVVQEYDENGYVKSIKLIFKNTETLELVENIIGLEFIDENGNFVEIEYEIFNNEIIINLEKEQLGNEISNSAEESSSDLGEDISDISDISDDKYIKLSCIRYAQDSFIYTNNLKNQEVGVIPFVIMIK